MIHVISYLIKEVCIFLLIVLFLFTSADFLQAAKYPQIDWDEMKAEIKKNEKEKNTMPTTDWDEIEQDTLPYPVDQVDNSIDELVLRIAQTVKEKLSSHDAVHLSTRTIRYKLQNVTTITAFSSKLRERLRGSFLENQINLSDSVSGSVYIFTIVYQVEKKGSGSYVQFSPKLVSSRGNEEVAIPERYMEEWILEKTNLPFTEIDAEKTAEYIISDLDDGQFDATIHFDETMQVEGRSVANIAGMLKKYILEKSKMSKNGLVFVASSKKAQLTATMRVIQKNDNRAAIHCIVKNGRGDVIRNMQYSFPIANM